MTSKAIRDRLIKKHGEKHRWLITDALKWLDEREPKWGLKSHINREKFIRELLRGSKRFKDATGVEPDRFAGAPEPPDYDALDEQERAQEVMDSWGTNEGDKE